MNDFLTNEEIGRKIKAVRLQRGLTQTQLGEKLGVGAAAVNKWETGLVKNIKREMLRQISLTLDIHPATLIGLNTNEIVIREDEFNSDELQEIKNYINYVKSKRG